MDPEMLRFFKKIINSFFLGFTWVFAVVTFGLFYQWGYINGALRWQPILFYTVTIITLFWLIRYYYKSWK